MITALIGMTIDPNSRNRITRAGDEREADRPGARSLWDSEEVVADRGAAADLR